MSRAAATQATPNLYMVTIQNLDGTTKTVLKSQPLQGAISCYELTPDQINVLWFAGQADLPGDRGPMPAIIRRGIALFMPHTRTDDLHSKTLLELDEAQRERARHIALAINTPKQCFLPLGEFKDLSADDTPEIREEKRRKQKQANYAIPNDVLDAALNGDEAIVKMMLEKNEGYLLYRGTASDFSGRKYENLTPFQAALITGDVEMAEMMKPFFDRLRDGKAEMKKQFDKIISNDNAKQKKKLEVEFARMLNTVIEAIKGASNKDVKAAHRNKHNNSRLYSVLQEFRAEFTRLMHSEKVFNPSHLLNALRGYEDKFYGITSFFVTENQRSLFWLKVYGFMQRFLPVNYAQFLIYGLNKIFDMDNLTMTRLDKNDVPMKSRSLIYESGVRFSFNPRSTNYPAGWYGRQIGFCDTPSWVGIEYAPFSRPLSSPFSALIERKEAGLEKVMRDDEHRCSIQ